MTEAIVEHNRIPNIHSYFVGNKPQINVFQDRTERSDFLRTVKPPKPAIINSNVRPNTFMIPGMPGMPGMMPMNPMGMMNPMGNPMGMPSMMAMMNPYFPGAPSQNPVAAKVSK